MIRINSFELQLSLEVQRFKTNPILFIDILLE